MDENNNCVQNSLFDFSFDDVTITQLDRLPTQDLIAVDLGKDNRYGNVRPETAEDLERRTLERLPKSTRRQNCWAMTAYEDWAAWRNTQADTLLGDAGAVPTDLWNQSLVCMNYWLSRFIVECRRKDGSPYPPNTLYNITTSIQRKLRDEYGRNEVNMLDSADINFADLRKQLDSRMKELTNQGVGIHRQRADPVTEEDEQRLWDTGVIGISSAKALSNGVFIYNCKIFWFRGGDEHRQLHTSQYRITEENGVKVLTCFGRNSKNVQGGLKQRRVEPKVIKQFEDPENDRCVVRLFDIYLKNIPNGDFYLRPLPGKLGKPIFFSSQKIGINFLSKYMKNMFTEAGIDIQHRNIRNHSGKVTLCTRLYDHQFDEQAIMSRSGHRSVAVRDYKRPSAELMKSVSSALQPKPSKESIATPSPQQPNGPAKSDKVPVSATVSETKPDLSNDSQDTIEISVPSSISTIVVNKGGRKISIIL